MPLPILAALAGAALGRATTPKKIAVSKTTRKDGTKVKQHLRRKPKR
jgi:hypothetical protein